MSRSKVGLWFLLLGGLSLAALSGCKPRTGPCTTCPQPPNGTLTATPTLGSTSPTFTPTGTITSPTNTPTCACITGTPTFTPSPTSTQPVSVTVTPTNTLCPGIFGNSVVGDSNSTFPPNLWFSPFQPSGNQVIYNLSIYNPGEYALGIYSDNGGVPTTLLGETGVQAATSTGWNTVALNQPVSLTAGVTYWLCEHSTNQYYVTTNSGAVYVVGSAGYTFTNLPNPLIGGTTSYTGRVFSIYGSSCAPYPGSTSTFTPTPTYTWTPTPPSPTATWTPSAATYTFTPTATLPGCNMIGDPSISFLGQLPVDYYEAMGWTLPDCGSTLTGVSAYLSTDSTAGNVETALYDGTTRVFSGSFNPPASFSGWVTVSTGSLPVNCGDTYTLAVHSLSAGVSLGSPGTTGCASAYGNYFSLLPATLPFTLSPSGFCFSLGLQVCGGSGTATWTPTPVPPTSTWTPSGSTSTFTPSPTWTNSPVPATNTPTSTPGTCSGSATFGSSNMTSAGPAETFSQSTSAGHLVASQYTLPVDATVDSISIVIPAVTPMTPPYAQVQMGIYSDTGSGPGTLVCQASAAYTGVNLVTGTFPPSQHLTAGTYWLAAAATIVGSSTPVIPGSIMVTYQSGTTQVGLNEAGIFGLLPNSITSPTFNSNLYELSVHYCPAATATPTPTPSGPVASWQVVGSANFSSSTYNPDLVVAGGVPYVGFEDGNNGGKATVAQFSGSWSPLGSAGLSPGLADYESLSFDNLTGLPYLAYGDGANGLKVSVMSYDGSSWVTVGSPGLSMGGAAPSLVVYNNTPYVAFQDGGNGNLITVLKYNGSSWVTFGSPGLTGSTSVGANKVGLQVDLGTGTFYLACGDAASNKVTVMKATTSGVWSLVGSAGFSDNLSGGFSLAVSNNIPYVAYSDSDHSGNATVEEYNGGWSLVGSAGFTAGAAMTPSLFVDNGAPYLAFLDGTVNKVSVMKYSGTWQLVGSAGFSVGTGIFQQPSLYVDGGNPYVAYLSGFSPYPLTVMEYH